MKVLSQLILYILLSVMAHASPKIVVVGAGIAGLTAAYRLHQKQCDVHLYEARHREGGRIFTAMVDGHPAEFGGQNFLDGGETVNVRRLIDELHLDVFENTFPFDAEYYENDQLTIDHALLKELKFKNLREELERLAQRSKNMEEVLLQLLGEENSLYRYLCMFLEAYEGGPVSKLSPCYIETLCQLLLGGLSPSHPADEEDAHIKHMSIKGGNYLLAKKLAESLGARMHKDRALKSVAKNGRGYLLTFNNGETVAADILVLAIPCSVYEDIAFEDGVIPKERRAAIENVQYGTPGKILVPLREIPHSRMQLQDYAGSFFNPDGHVLNLYLFGEKGRFSKENLQALYDENSHLIEIGYEGAVLPPEKPVMARDELCASYKGPVGHSWQSDPYAKGSYTYVAAGQEETFTAVQEVEGELVKTLFAPIDGSLFFAGEHASILFEVSGTMEAACESGERTARMISD